MDTPHEAVRTHRHLRRYILSGEKVTVATRLHWAKLLEPIATALAVTVLVAWLHSATGTGWVWLLWTVAAGRFLFRWAEWNYEWFVATDKRLILTYGFIIHKVAMMPLMKVTDMGYSRTPTGQLLGYGRFVMESAGQDQALRQVDYVPDPDHTYRTLCDTIFMRRPAPGPGQAESQGRPSSPPPAIVPSGPREPRPTTAELPVVKPSGPGDRTDSARVPAPGHGQSWRTTGQPSVPRPFESSDASPDTQGSAGRRTAGRKGWLSAVRRPPRRGARGDSPFDPPSSDGPGTTVPDAFL